MSLAHRPDRQGRGCPGPTKNERHGRGRRGKPWSGWLKWSLLHPNSVRQTKGHSGAKSPTPETIHRQSRNMVGPICRESQRRARVNLTRIIGKSDFKDWGKDEFGTNRFGCTGIADLGDDWRSTVDFHVGRLRLGRDRLLSDETGGPCGERELCNFRTGLRRAFMGGFSLAFGGFSHSAFGCDHRTLRVRRVVGGCCRRLDCRNAGVRLDLFRRRTDVHR